MRTLREAWTTHIRARDYELHMANAGQAQANAGLFANLLRTNPPPADAAILVAGAGTGQMFEYIDQGLLAPFRTTFTDINPDYLARLAGRVKGVRFDTRVDDIEATTLSGPFSLAIAILVLEHVDWRRAVANLCRLSNSVFTVIQENPPDHVPSALRGTMDILREAPPHTVAKEELRSEFEALGYNLDRTESREVPDQKRMLGLLFLRDSTSRR